MLKQDLILQINYELEKPLSREKKLKSFWINERAIIKENNDRVCHIKTKNI